MKKILLAVLVIVIAIVAFYWFKLRKDYYPADAVKTQAIQVGAHSEAFNKEISDLLSSYFSVKDAFVSNDTAKIKANVAVFTKLIDSTGLDELKADTSGIYESVKMVLNDVKLNAESILQQKDIAEMRQDFRMVNENMYPFLKSIHYSGATLYWQGCPMAFGEGNEGNWLSTTPEVINPYATETKGNDKMLHCGEIKDSIK